MPRSRRRAGTKKGKTLVQMRKKRWGEVRNARVVRERERALRGQEQERKRVARLSQLAKLQESNEP
jgi:hypothetical protein